MHKASKIAIAIRKTSWLYKTITSFRLLFFRNEYTHLRYFLFFLGYPRSGSSTLATLLDAHESIIVSHELNVLELLSRGFKQKQLFYLIKKNSRLFNKKGRVSTGYTGLIEGQFNGRARPLKIIGDKKAGRSSLLVATNPDLLKQLKSTVKISVKCIHIVRNPFDMITTQAYGGNLKQKMVSEGDIQNAMAFCFKKIDTISELLEQKQLDIYTMQHEDLIRNPKETLSELFKWLELVPSEPYLEACKNHLFNTPNKSREKYAWSEAEIESVTRKIEETTFLQGYNFMD